MSGAMPGGRRQRLRGGMDPQRVEAQRAMMRIALARPTRVTLELDDSTFVVTQSPGGRAAMPMDGEEVELGRTEWPTKVRVKWDDRMPRLERAFEGGGKVVDHFELVSRDRLLLTRRIEGGPGGDIEVRYAFDRTSGG